MRLRHPRTAISAPAQKAMRNQGIRPAVQFGPALVVSPPVQTSLHPLVPIVSMLAVIRPDGAHSRTGAYLR